MRRNDIGKVLPPRLSDFQEVQVIQRNCATANNEHILSCISID